MALEWLKTLQIGDVILVERDGGVERLEVIRDCRPHGAIHYVWVKRPHLKVRKTLRVSEYPNKIDVVWSLQQGYCPEDYTKWKVIRASPV
jgi:hypothetical protein